MQESRERISCLSNSIVHAPEENVNLVFYLLWLRLLLNNVNRSMKKKINFCRFADWRICTIFASAQSWILWSARWCKSWALPRLHRSLCRLYPAIGSARSLKRRRIRRWKEIQRSCFTLSPRCSPIISNFCNYSRRTRWVEFLAVLYCIYYMLAFLELVRCAKLDESTFTAKFGILCTRCLCKLLDKASHFNYAVNVINCLIQLTKSTNEKVSQWKTQTLQNQNFFVIFINYFVANAYFLLCLSN